MTDRVDLGTFTDPDGMVTLLRARQVELGLSNEGLERVCGFAPGQVNKYLGPSREKTPGALVLGTLMDGLGLSGLLYVDPTKVARLSRAWAREGRRRGSSVRPESGRVSKVMMKRARPQVVREWASKAAKAKWEDVTSEQRQAWSERMHQKRYGKRRLIAQKLRAPSQE